MSGLFRCMFLGAVFCSAAYAASIHCEKASTSVEKTICADPELMALDTQLNDAYQTVLNRAGRNASFVRSLQRIWMLNAFGECDGRPDIHDCVRDKETHRIEELKEGIDIDESTLITFRVNNASKNYDFAFRLLPDGNSTSQDTDEGPAEIRIFKKGAHVPFQTISMDNVFLSRDSGGKPLVNSAPLYDYQGVINVGDFNFDGHEDFAIQNGNNGSYGGPSYDVYLYSPAKNRFVYSPPLSNLIEETLGFFSVDPVKKRITTFGKGGCCYHETVTYAVINDKPVAVERYIENAMNVDDKDGVAITEERLVGGKWKKRTYHRKE
jgi:uncharacterized protein YecT (DUF1311 family)